MITPWQHLLLDNTVNTSIINIVWLSVNTLQHCRLLHAGNAVFGSRLITLSLNKVSINCDVSEWEPRLQSFWKFSTEQRLKMTATRRRLPQWPRRVHSSKISENRAFPERKIFDKVFHSKSFVAQSDCYENWFYLTYYFLFCDTFLTTFE